MLTIGPARAFSLPGGTLAVGSVADVTVFDPEREWTVDPRSFKSKSRNTPFKGWQLRGAVAATFVAGSKINLAPKRVLIAMTKYHKILVLVFLAVWAWAAINPSMGMTGCLRIISSSSSCL